MEALFLLVLVLPVVSVYPQGTENHQLADLAKDLQRRICFLCDAQCCKDKVGLDFADSESFNEARSGRKVEESHRSYATNAAKMSYSIVERGTVNSLDYRVYFKGPDGLVSPFHDIPLRAKGSSDNVFNMVVEIPRWTNAKMEIDTTGKLNPIKQDVKKGKLRYVNNCFPHHGYIWNYGALPQTWEDPSHQDVHTGQNGDNDPLDLCEIGFKVHKRGSVIQVKVLGVMALIDEGETDWKVLVIDVTDPLADDLNDIDDIEKHMPGFLRATHEWFRIYKIPTGKPENQFAFNGEAKNKEFALQIIQQTNDQWKRLVNQSVDNIGLACENTAVAASPYKVSQVAAQAAVDEAPPYSASGPALDADVDKWYYVKL